jgi:hypothetical protein
MYPPRTVSEVNEFVARRDGWQYKVYAIFFSAALALLLTLIYSQSLYTSKRILLIIGFFVFVTAYMWYMVLNKSIQLTINQEGIWKTKKKVIPWHTIQSFYIKARHHKVASYFLFIETSSYRTIKMNVSDLDKSYHEIAEAIMLYSDGSSIEYLGISRKVP